MSMRRIELIALLFVLSFNVLAQTVFNQSKVYFKDGL